jgi:uncharacterized membrane protein
MSVNRQTGSINGATERTPLLGSASVADAQETQLSGPSSSSTKKAPGRQIALDLLRGLLMALMAMDHTSVTVNAYVHGTGMQSEAATKIITEWNRNMPYIMRTLTHLCASGFTMLLGVGIAYVTESVSLLCRPYMSMKLIALPFPSHRESAKE